MLRARKCVGVALYGDDARPFFGESKGDGVTTCAGKNIDYCSPFLPTLRGEKLGGRRKRRRKILGNLVGDGFGGDAKPSCVGEADVPVVKGEDGLALVEVFLDRRGNGGEVVVVFAEGSEGEFEAGREDAGWHFEGWLLKSTGGGLAMVVR